MNTIQILKPKCDICGRVSVESQDIEYVRKDKKFMKLQ
jgi:hypothetical protein